MAARSHAFKTVEGLSGTSGQHQSATSRYRISTTRLPNAQPQRARVGEFEVDLRTGELRAGMTTVRLQEQPFRILRMLLGHDGEIVTRDQIQESLWADGTIVDFGHSINAAIKKLRQAFGDSADEPRYIETIARRGYRLMLPVQWSPGVTPAGPITGKPGGESVPPGDDAHRADSGTASPHSPTVLMPDQELQDRVLFLERLVLSRVRNLRRRPRCLFQLRTSAPGRSTPRS